MSNLKKLLVIIPARSGSKGLPDKNIRKFCGKPLLAWPIRVAIESGVASRVVLSTDSKKYATIGEKFGAEVSFLRPRELALDSSPSYGFIEHCLKWYREQRGETFEYVALLEPTSPLTNINDFKKAYKALLDHNLAESITSVTRADAYHPSFAMSKNNTGLLSSAAFPNGLRRQDLDECFFLDGGLYISSVESFLKNKGFYHEKMLGIELAEYKSIEIDTLKDFICAEALMKNKEVLLND